MATEEEKNIEYQEEKHDNFLAAIERQHEQAASDRSAIALLEQTPEVGFDNIVPEIGSVFEKFVSKFARNGINIRHTDPKGPLELSTSYFYKGTPSRMVYFSIEPLHSQITPLPPRIPNKPVTLDLYELVKIKPHELLKVICELRFVNAQRTIEVKVQTWGQHESSTLPKLGHRRVFATSEGEGMQNYDIQHTSENPKEFAEKVYTLLVHSDPNIIERYYRLTGNRLASLPEAA